MFQKFNVDTLGGRFIKALLAQTPIPVFDCVFEGDYIVEGCYYVFRNYIIKCHTSGTLYLPTTERLFPSDTLYPASNIYPRTKELLARFYVLSDVKSEDKQCFSTYASRTNYYDSDTHYQLGRYLRYLYSTTDLNLFPFYNSYTSKELTNLELFISKSNNVSDKGNSSNDTSQNNTTQQASSSFISAKRVVKQRYKIVAIPITYARKYRIYLDCPTQVLMRAGIVDNNRFVEDLSSYYNSNLLLDDILAPTSQILTSCSFKSPQTFKLNIDDILDHIRSKISEDERDAKLKQISQMLLRSQRGLCLLIQLPLTNNSSIVVMEDYDLAGVQKSAILNPSLTRMNTYCSFAFSDRLIEYLLGNVIHKNEQIYQNIQKVQKALFDDCAKVTGIWDDSISNKVFELVLSYSQENLIYDQDGYINKDVETIIQKNRREY